MPVGVLGTVVTLENKIRLPGVGVKIYEMRE